LILGLPTIDTHYCGDRIHFNRRKVMSSLWRQYNIENRLIRILREVDDEGHHFGRPFLTAYQLAIEFDRQHPGIVQECGYEVGGAGTGLRNSLAQYLALELSRHIRDNPDYPIEGAFISNQAVRELSYNYDQMEIRSSLTGSGQGLSMFRLR
jgi:hypothetical protein